ncbi:MAG: hydratase [Defluviitaleaceae bacterium]|nr:hydratase [Defluviitaleaceae bacterium]
MIKLYGYGAFVSGGIITPGEKALHAKTSEKNMLKRGTIALQVLESHSITNAGSGLFKDYENLKIKFDALASHDITYVGIIQTALASVAIGENFEFPLPYTLTCCHNSLCAVGGTINADDHAFGRSAAKKFGGVFVPPHVSVIHQYMRECMCACGGMILGSDSHTRYGALGVMGIGEGGGELVKQLLGKTYDIKVPEVVGVYLTGEPARGVGPQDIALAIIGATFENGYVKNKVMEFFGPGLKNLSADYRLGIDVMTTETACLSSVWETDEIIEEYYAAHGRENLYRKLEMDSPVYYDGFIELDLSKVEPMVALPFHPSRVFTIKEAVKNAGDIFSEDESLAFLRDKIYSGRLCAQQGIIAGCAGGLFENLCEAAKILQTGKIKNGFALSVYPASLPVTSALVKDGVYGSLLEAGAVIKTAFCGPCFGAGDIPQNNGLSLRHVTRNFPNREGSKPNNGQTAAVMLMDARSIAASAVNGGSITPATEINYEFSKAKYFFDKKIYDRHVYDGTGKPDPAVLLAEGPGIKPWPAFKPLAKNILMYVASYITDPVTTTDELIPSGETSSYRSNPQALAEYTLSRKDPEYVKRAKSAAEEAKKYLPELPPDTAAGSVIFAVKPGDGSAREQAASCQRVLGGLANIANEYATKRYRSNLVNWGLLPFTTNGEPPFKTGDFIFVPGIRKAVKARAENISAFVLHESEKIPFDLKLPSLTEDEAKTLLYGCLINRYAAE